MFVFDDFCILQIKPQNNNNANCVEFVNKITTNLITTEPNCCTYTCILTPQGRFVLDMFFYQTSLGYFIEIHKKFYQKLLHLLKIYDIEEDFVFAKAENLKTLFIPESNKDKILSNKQIISFKDPRAKSFGFRCFANTENIKNLSKNNFNYDYYRIQHKICEGWADLIPEKSIILEFGFEALNAISFTKGCYPGQELMARTKHRGQIRKRVALAKINKSNNYDINEEENINPDDILEQKILSTNCEIALALVKFKN